jgi:hypothetical protein
MRYFAELLIEAYYSLIQPQLIHWQQLVAGLQTGKTKSLPIENIIATKHYLPYCYSVSAITVMQLIDREAHLHSSWHKVKQSSVVPASRSELQGLLQDCLDLDAEFQAWESSVPFDWRCQMERNTADARSTYDSKWRNLILQGRGAPEEIHTYTNLRRCWMWMFCRTARIFLLRDMLEILNWMCRLPEPPQNPGQSLNDSPGASKGSRPGTLDDVGLQIHQSFATTNLVAMIEKSCSAVIGNFTVPIYGKSDQDVAGIRGFIVLWSLGVMDAVLKSGLVPDTDVPLTPPSSNRASPQSSRASMFSLSTPSPAYDTAAAHPGEAPSRTLPNERSDSKGHIFDTSPNHPFDYPVGIPALAFTITKPARIDVVARREWINRLLYYIGTELGIGRALAVPKSEGYLEKCKTQVEALLTQ